MKCNLRWPDLTEAGTAAEVVAVYERMARNNRMLLTKEHYLHVSCEAKMIDVPLNPLNPLDIRTRKVPYVWGGGAGGKGLTYNVGRNEAKRTKKAMLATFKALSKKLNEQRVPTAGRQVYVGGTLFDCDTGLEVAASGLAQPAVKV